MAESKETAASNCTLTWSAGETRVLDYILQTILRGSDPRVAMRARDFSSVVRKVNAAKAHFEAPAETPGRHMPAWVRAQPQCSFEFTTVAPPDRSIVEYRCSLWPDLWVQGVHDGETPKAALIQALKNLLHHLSDDES